MGRGGAGEHVPVLEQGMGSADGCLLLRVSVLPTEFAAVVESGSAGGGGGLNLYGFVGNGSVARIDSFGLYDLLSAPPTTAPDLGLPSVPGVTTPAEIAAANANTAAELGGLGEEALGGGPLTAILAAGASGTLLIGDLIGVQRDAELYPDGVNGVPQTASSMLPPRKPPCNNKIASGFPGDENHDHHRLPRQFEPWFSSSPRNLNIENYKTPMPQQWHTGEDIGIHPNGYNGMWGDFIMQNPAASAQQTLDFLQYLEKMLGFGVLPP